MIPIASIPNGLRRSAKNYLLRSDRMPSGFDTRTRIGLSLARMKATVLLAALVRDAHFAQHEHPAHETTDRVTLRLEVTWRAS